MITPPVIQSLDEYSYKSIFPYITILDINKGVVTNAYAENGMVVIHGHINNTANGLFKLFKITEPKYIPRANIYEVAQSVQSLGDSEKVVYNCVDTNGNHAILLKEAPVDYIYFTFKYPMRRN